MADLKCNLLKQFFSRSQTVALALQSLILLIGQLYFDFPLNMPWIGVNHSLNLPFGQCFQMFSAFVCRTGLKHTGAGILSMASLTWHTATAAAEIGHCGNHCDPWDPPRNSGPDSNGLHPIWDVDIVVENPCIEHTLNTHGTRMELRWLQWKREVLLSMTPLTRDWFVLVIWASRVSVGSQARSSSLP